MTVKVLAASFKMNCNEWVLDSSCSFHMCPDFNVFILILKRMLVRCCMEIMCPVILRCSVTMFDGTVKTLAIVRLDKASKKKWISYVPGLKKKILDIYLMNMV